MRRIEYVMLELAAEIANPRANARLAPGASRATCGRDTAARGAT